MATLRELRRKAAQKIESAREAEQRENDKKAQKKQKEADKAQNTLSSVSAPSVVEKPSTPPKELQKIKELENQIALQDAQLKALRERISDLMNRKMDVEVQAGDVEVNMPERPTSLTIEFEDGRTATVTPNYE